MEANKNIQELNSAFQKYFRSSKRIRIHSRKGVFVVVDDRDEAVDLVKKLFISRGENQKIISSKNVSEAQQQIQNHDNGNGIKAVIIDLGLDGEGQDGDGVYLAQWLNEEYPDIPFIFSTGRENRIGELEKEFPGVDIFIKGKDSLYELAESLGLNVEDKFEELVCIPTDNVTGQEKVEDGVFGFMRRIFAS